MDDANSIRLRKLEHLRVCMEKDVSFRKSNGFERYEFEYHALPEINLSDIDLSTKFLGHDFKMPFFIDALTGGADGTEVINRNLAGAAQQLGLGMGVGSQRAMLENPDLIHTYQVRDVAPDIFLLGNLGASQLLNYNREQVGQLVTSVGASGMAFHLNPLQELVQAGGDTNWRNVLAAIKTFCQTADVPVVVKEVGSGLSARVAGQLASAGAVALNVAGAGGTSFARVEYYRGSSLAAAFFEWGIPTAESLQQCLGAVSVPLIASGGIRNGLECAKALAMGAGLVGFALPLLKPAMESAEAVIEKINRIALELKKTMLLLGACNMAELKSRSLNRVDFLNETPFSRGGVAH
ncbi:MAG: type 2 isopentenyl-diphosphate Delta-isomerase [Pseudomonadota bacterium]